MLFHNVNTLIFLILMTTEILSTKKELKKHVATIHTSGVLSFSERKLLNVLLLNAFDNLLDKRIHSIPVKLLMPLIGWTDSSNTVDLKKSLSKLTTTEVKFDLLGDSKEEWGTTAFLAHAKIKDGICTYEYSSFLSTKMANPEIYGTINISMQNQFSGGYALNLYENCKRFRKVGSTGFIEVNKWRDLLGASAAMYDDFRHFSNHVIKKAMNEINKVSDIHIEVEYQRHIRKVTHLRFLITDNSQRSIYEIAMETQENGLNLLRETAAYKRLFEHGIGDKLALSMINEQGESRVIDLIEYVENKDKKKQIKGSTAGYIRTLANVGAIIKPTYEINKTKNEIEANASINKIDNAEIQKQATFKKFLKDMTLEQKRDWVTKYFSTEGLGRESFFNAEKCEFSKGEPNIHFMNWMRAQFAT